MRADGGEAVEVRKREGPAEGTNEEDGRHGLRGCSEVGVFGGRRGELVRMRSKRRRRGAVARRVIGGFQPRAEPPWSPRLFGGGELVRMRSNGEGGAPWPEGSSAAHPGNQSQRTGRGRRHAGRWR